MRAANRLRGPGHQTVEAKVISVSVPPPLDPCGRSALHPLPPRSSHRASPVLIPTSLAVTQASLNITSSTSGYPALFACDDRPQYALDLQAISRTAAPSLPALDADARLYLSVASPTSYVRMQKRAGLENSTWPCTLPGPRTAVKFGRLGCIKSILNCMESFADIPQASAAACTPRQTQHTLKITSCPCHLIPS